MHHPCGSQRGISPGYRNPILPQQLIQHPQRHRLLLEFHHPAVNRGTGNRRGELHLFQPKDAVDQDGGVHKGSEQVPSYRDRVEITPAEGYSEEIE